ASSGKAPRAMARSVSWSRYDASSSARSRSIWFRRKKRVQLMALLLCGFRYGFGPRAAWAQHQVDRARQSIPATGLVLQLFASGCGEPVVARAAIVFGRSPEGCDPVALLQAV